MELPFCVCLHVTGFSGRNVVLPAFPCCTQLFGKNHLQWSSSLSGGCLEYPGHPPAGGVAKLPWTLQFPVGEWILHSMVVRTTIKPRSALKKSFPLPGCGIRVSHVLWHIRRWVCVRWWFCRRAEWFTWKLPIALSDFGNSYERIKWDFCWVPEVDTWEHVCGGLGFVWVDF